MCVLGTRPGSLQEQRVPLATEPSLQLQLWNSFKWGWEETVSEILSCFPYILATLQLVVYIPASLTLVNAGADVEAVEGCCLLACSSRFAQSAFLQNPGPPAQGCHLPELSPLMMGWAFPLNH